MEIIINEFEFEEKVFLFKMLMFRVCVYVKGIYFDNFFYGEWRIIVIDY